VELKKQFKEVFMTLASDYVQAFPILEDIDDANKVGVPLSQAVEGDPIAGRDFAGMLTAKDASDNLRFPKVNSQNELIVDTDSGEMACVTGNAKVTGGTSEQTIVDVTLVAGRTYRQISWIVACIRQAEFRIVHVDDPAGTPAETELGTLLVGPGDYTDSGEDSCLEFTAGATDPVLRVVGTNKDVASDLRAKISALEVQ
jgi:hypothetical protein